MTTEAPTRISANSDDPGAITLAHIRAGGLEPRITLDGVEQSGVVTADTVQGVVERIEQPPRVVWDRDAEGHSFGSYATETLRGRVEIALESRKDPTK